MVWLTTAIDAPGQQYLHRPARDWLIIWLSVSVLGMLIQWAGLVKRKKAKPAREARE